MNPGKLFEQDFQNSVPHYVYLHRLKDCPGWVSACHCPGGASPRFMPSNDYDYAMYWDGTFWALELKSTKGVSFRFDCLRTNQRDGLLVANRTPGVAAGLLLNFRKDEETWWVPIRTWLGSKKRAPRSRSTSKRCERSVHRWRGGARSPATIGT